MKRIHKRGLKGFGGVRLRQAATALKEDIFLGDPTTEAVVVRNSVLGSRIVCLEPGVVAGVEEALSVLGRGCCGARVKSGEVVGVGDVVIDVEMRPSELFKRVRTALNYLSHLSGLATNARRLVGIFGEGRVAALRKTHPGLGASEKAALWVGGVMPHRVNLGDGILIKKEHISLVQKEVGFPRVKAVSEAVLRAKRYARHRKLFLEIEVETLEEALEAANAGPDAILLDNFPVSRVGGVVKKIRRINRDVLIEASGGIRESGVRGYLGAGVDVVSGSFVFNARPLEFRFELL